MRAKVWIILVAIASIALAAAAVAQEAPPAPNVLTIDDAVRAALRNSPLLAESRGQVRQANARRQEAEARRNPTAQAVGRASLQGPVPSFSIPNPITGRIQTISFGRTFTREAEASATYSPDLSGRLRAGVRVAERDVNVALTRVDADVNDLVLSAQRGFLAVLRTQELTLVAAEAVAAAREQLRVATARRDAGDAPDFDVLRASVQVANLTQDLVAARANEERAMTTLARILSVERDLLPPLAPVLLPPGPEQVAESVAQQALSLEADGSLAAAPPSAELALAEALSRRPEVIRGEWALRLAQARIDVERRGRRPELSVTAGYLFSPDQSGFVPLTNSWSIVANLSISLWDGGVTRARVGEAKRALETAVATQAGVRDIIREEVRTSLVSLHEAADRRIAAAATTAEAREALRIARVRYDAGVSAPVEITDAEVALTRARTIEVNAGYDYLDALAQLNRGLGRYSHYAALAQ